MLIRHLRTRSALAGLLVLTGLTVHGGQAFAAPGLVVPRGATIAVHGRGYGHGHGMSQYGAQGAAKQGKSTAQILGFYYPGTRLGRAGGPIKVLLTADDKDVTVDARSGLRLHRLGGRSYLLSKVRPKATRWRIVPRGDKSVVSFRVRRGWTRWTARSCATPRCSASCSSTTTSRTC